MKWALTWILGILTMFMMFLIMAIALFCSVTAYLIRIPSSLLIKVSVLLADCSLALGEWYTKLTGVE